MVIMDHFIPQNTSDIAHAIKNIVSQTYYHTYLALVFVWIDGKRFTLIQYYERDSVAKSAGVRISATIAEYLPQRIALGALYGFGDRGVILGETYTRILSKIHSFAHRGRWETKFPGRCRTLVRNGSSYRGLVMRKENLHNLQASIKKLGLNYIYSARAENGKIHTVEYEVVRIDADETTDGTEEDEYMPGDRLY